MKRKIRNYLINRRLQLRLTTKFLVLIFFFCTIIGLLVYHTIWPVVSGFVPLALITHLKQQIFFRLFCFSMPLVLVISACCIVFTHKIAGPVFNMEQKLEKLIKGEDAQMIILRQGDELQDLAEKINKIIDVFKHSKMTQKNSDVPPDWLKK